MQDDAAVWAAIEEIRGEVARLKAGIEEPPRGRAIAIMLHARLVFDAPEKADAWLVERSADLDGRSPLEAALESADGRTAAMDLLMKLGGRDQELERDLDALLARLPR